MTETSFLLFKGRLIWMWLIVQRKQNELRSAVLELLIRSSPLNCSPLGRSVKGHDSLFSQTVFYWLIEFDSLCNMWHVQQRSLLKLAHGVIALVIQPLDQHIWHSFSIKEWQNDKKKTLLWSPFHSLRGNCLTCVQCCCALPHLVQVRAFINLHSTSISGTRRSSESRRGPSEMQVSHYTHKKCTFTITHPSVPSVCSLHTRRCILIQKRGRLFVWLI